jgi:hypothetical protein
VTWLITIGEPAAVGLLFSHSVSPVIATSARKLALTLPVRKFSISVGAALPVSLLHHSEVRAVGAPPSRRR